MFADKINFTPMTMRLPSRGLGLEINAEHYHFVILRSYSRKLIALYSAHLEAVWRQNIKSRR